jgi:hypothetical protein
MRDLFVGRILAGWDRAHGLPASEQACALLAAAFAQTPEQELAKLPLGDRDRRLLELRAILFGEHMAGLARCTNCHERLELDFAVSDIYVKRPDHADDLRIEAAGFIVDMRLPRGSDLAALADSEDAGSARRLLFERCVIKASSAGAPVAVADLPEPVVAAAAERMAEQDPQANIELNVECPSCGHASQAVFDIASFLWHEVEASALRILRDVHELALAYGWPEAEILSLSPARRQLYLEMLAQ